MKTKVFYHFLFIFETLNDIRSMFCFKRIVNPDGITSVSGKAEKEKENLSNGSSIRKS